MAMAPNPINLIGFGDGYGPTANPAEILINPALLEDFLESVVMEHMEVQCQPRPELLADTGQSRQVGLPGATTYLRSVTHFNFFKYASGPENGHEMV